MGTRDEWSPGAGARPRSGVRSNAELSGRAVSATTQGNVTRLAVPVGASAVGSNDTLDSPFFLFYCQSSRGSYAHVFISFFPLFGLSFHATSGCRSAWATGLTLRQPLARSCSGLRLRLVSVIRLARLRTRAKPRLAHQTRHILSLSRRDCSSKFSSTTYPGQSLVF